jgi:superfamily II DNA/RNA helicase
LNNDVAQLVAYICRHVIPPDWQTLVFISSEDQANKLMEHMPEGTLAMAKVLTDAEREDITRRMQNNEIKRCVASNIYSQGVTFSDVRVVINLAGGGGSITAVQKPGRLAEIRPNKKWGIMMDLSYELVDDRPEQVAATQSGRVMGGASADVVNDNEPDASAFWSVVRDCQARLRTYREKGYVVEMIDGRNQLKQVFDKYAQAQ